MFCLEEFYTNSWRRLAGKKEIEFKKLDYSGIDELYETQWSKQFEKYMRNRLVMGSLRYGDIRGNKGYPFIDYLKHKLNIYEVTGNLEMLVDVSNLGMLEYINSIHPNKHWPDTFESNIHCERS